MRLLGVFLVAMQAWGAITLVNTAACAGASGGNSATTAAVSMTGSTLLVMGCASSANAAMSDSSSNTWVAATQRSANAAKIQFFYVFSPTVSGSQTFTCTATAGTASVCGYGFSSTDTTGTVDQENGDAQFGFKTSLATGSVTPSTAGQVLVSGLSFEATNTGGNTPTIDLSFNTPITLNFSSGNNGISLSYLIQTSAAATNPTWTFNGGSFPTAVNIGTWKAGSGAVTATPGRLIGFGQ